MKINQIITFIAKKKKKNEGETKEDMEMHRGKRTTGRGSSLVRQRLSEEYYFLVYTKTVDSVFCAL